ncbi:MAG: hypothetical protein Q8880_07505 [Bacteroidota bacterium]|nr:hypothetical protein [Bacteroidota bacterium]
MAKNNNPFDDFEGTLGDRNYYRRNGKKVVRLKPGPTPEQVQTSKEFENSRKAGKEFGGCSSVAKVFTELLSQVSDGNLISFLHPKLVSIFINFAIADDGDKGKRKIVVSKNKEFLDELQLHPTLKLRNGTGLYRCRMNNFDTKYFLKLDKENLKLDMHIPDYNPTDLMKKSPGATHFRIRLSLFSISDYGLNEKTGKYEPVSKGSNGLINCTTTEFIKLENKDIKDINLSVKLDAPEYSHEDATLFAAIEIFLDEVIGGKAYMMRSPLGFFLRTLFI